MEMTYHELTPNFSVNGTLLRGYLGKVTKRVRLSEKSPTHKYDNSDAADGTTNCRETCASWIRDGIIYGANSSRSSGKPYIVLPIASMMNKAEKVICGESEIVLEYEDDSKFKGIPKSDIKNSLNYTLGIMGVLFCSDNNEIRRRKHKVGLPSDIDVDTDGGFSSDYVYIKYRVLSPLWFITPVTVSLVLGVARNIVSIAVNHNPLLHKELLDKISSSEINSIITNCDRDKAWGVYKKIIIPFFNNSEIKDSSVFLSREAIIESIEPIMKKGILSLLKAEMTVDYWDKYESHYGMSNFIQHCHSFNKLHENSIPNGGWECRY